MGCTALIYHLLIDSSALFACRQWYYSWTMKEKQIMTDPNNCIQRMPFRPERHDLDGHINSNIDKGANWFPIEKNSVKRSTKQRNEKINLYQQRSSCSSTREHENHEKSVFLPKV